MKNLNIPYIGIRIENIPSILKVLRTSKSDDDFTGHYIKLGKKNKTALEYLHSLRNLKLAKRDKGNNTVITSQGVYLLEDDIENLYKNLLKHCLSHFSDLKIVGRILRKSEKITLPLLISELEKEGYLIKRKQTLSSYLKLFYESGKLKSTSVRRPSLLGEGLEYNQFVKEFIKFTRNDKKDKFVIYDFYEHVSKNITIDLFTEFITILQREQKIKLYFVHQNVLKNMGRYITINGKTYYYFEVLKDVL